MRTSRFRNLRWLGAAFVAVVPAYVACGGDDTVVGITGTDANPPQNDAGASLGDGSSNIDASVSDASSLGDGAGIADSSKDSAVIDASPLPLPTRCNGSVASTPNPAAGFPAPSALTVPNGFTIETIASIPVARELAALPNGDLLVGTYDVQVYLIPNADSDTPNAPVLFAYYDGSPLAGLAYSPYTCEIYVGGNQAIFSIDYVDGQQTAFAGDPTLTDPIALVRQGPIAPDSDGDGSGTTSLGVANGHLFAGVSGSCNACTEVDPTRASIQEMDLTGANMTTYGTRVRNAIALATNPATGTLWAGGAGQNNLPLGHPYEYFDAVTSHAAVADYGWPDCEENHIAYVDGSDCASVVVPRVEMPAYSTIIGATFYPPAPTGAYAFGAPYQGGLFLAVHGGWHLQTDSNQYYTPPRVAFVPMNGDTPKTPVNWNDPSKQWTEFVGGFLTPDGTAWTARPTGVTVGRDGTLFVADDLNGLVYRVRPTK